MYAVTYDMICENYGRTFIRYYNDSPLKAVSEKYPDYDFLPWLFKHVPPDYWNDKKHQKKYMDWLGNKLGYTKIDDWYDITQTAFVKNRGNGLIRNHYNGSPSAAVMEIYPNYKWKPEEFSKHKKN